MDKKVIMFMDLEVAFKKKLKENEEYQFGIGGFTFDIDNKEIPFDMTDYGYSEYRNEDRIGIEWSSESNSFAGDTLDIDECYEEEYQKLGLTTNDITAEFLSKVDKIKEIYMEVERGYDDEPGYNPVVGATNLKEVNPEQYTVKINRISFVNEKNKEYFVKTDVLKHYNEIVSELPTTKVAGF